jgi:hypothetical protein
MAGWRETLQQRRPVVLAAGMIAALLVSVGVAAWLTVSRQQSRSKAVEILQHVRRQRLEAFWPRQREVAWYLRRARDGQAVGWEMEERVPTPTGYAGKRVIQLGSGVAREVWSVSANASAGRYHAETAAIVQPSPDGPSLLATNSSTRIELQSGRVDVRREDRRKIGHGAAEAPENYIPEGLHLLVYYLAAAGQREANFVTILNEEAILGSEVHFSWVQVVPEGRRRARVYGARQESVLDFDEGGRLLRREIPEDDAYYQRVSLETIVKVFPGAPLLAERSLRE